MIRNTLIALATVASVTAASATDLPSKKAPVAPVTQAADSTNGWYVGVRGGVVEDKDTATYGGNIGYEFGKYVRAEANYDYTDHKAGSLTGTESKMVTGNIIGQMPVGAGFTPYVLGGTGYRWSNGKDEAVYNFGGGVRYALVKNVELDGRYRNVRSYDNRSDNANVFTVGLNYKF